MIGSAIAMSASEPIVMRICVGDPGALAQRALLGDRGHRRGEAGAGDVEGAAHAHRGVDEPGGAGHPADAQPGEAVDLREGVEHRDARVARLDVLLEHVGVVVLEHVLGVGLVDHADDVLGQRVDEGAQGVAGDVGARRVVGVADVDQRRALGDGREHRVEVVDVVAAQGHRRRVRRLLLRGQGVGDEGRPGVDDLAARLEEGGGDVLDQHVGAGADRDHLGRQPAALGDHPHEGLRVGVAVQVARLGLERGPRGGQRALGALVRRELDDRHALRHARRRPRHVDREVRHARAQEHAARRARDASGLGHRGAAYRRPVRAEPGRWYLDVS